MIRPKKQTNKQTNKQTKNNNNSNSKTKYRIIITKSEMIKKENNKDMK